MALDNDATAGVLNLADEGTPESKKHKKHHRSPNYPAIDLTEAIAKAKIIYEKEQRVLTSRAVMAEHLGFPGVTGPAGRILSALKQYGLLDETSGQLRLSDEGYKIVVLSKESNERQGLIRAAAQRPQIFRELLSHYKGSLPSDATLKDHLITQKNFNPGWVDQFIKIFKSTNQLAKLTNGGYTADETSKETPLEQSEGAEMVEEQQEPQKRTGTPLNAASVYNLSTLLSYPRNVRAEIKITYGSELRRSDIARLKKVIGELEGAFEEDGPQE
jgi:hypothetical protein